MCLGRQKMPKEAKIAPSPEKTAGSLTTGKKRKGRRSGESRSSGGSGKNTGVGSLRIPLGNKGNLRYG